ncbi:MAG: hypothetical protein MIO93_10280 [ANME-2 cluster archaeon]|nr:hypothetical protein [ANME-2 cluster archaeon]
MDRQLCVWRVSFTLTATYGIDSYFDCTDLYDFIGRHYFSRNLLIIFVDRQYQLNSLSIKILCNNRIIASGIIITPFQSDLFFVGPVTIIGSDSIDIQNKAN